LLGGVDDGSVINWDVATGQILWQQKVQTREDPPWVEDWVQDVAFSPDGQYVAATYDDRIMFWHAADGQLFRKIESLVNRQKISFNPTGDQFATIGSEENSRLVIWDFASGEVVGEYQHGSNVEDIVYAADGSSILIAGKDGALILIDAHTGQVLQEFQEYTGSSPAALRNIALSPDGTQVIGAAVAAGLLVWDFSTGELLENYIYEGVLAAEFHPHDGSVLIGDLPLFRTVDLQTGAIMRTNSGHNRGIISLAVTADGSRAFTASVDESIRVWDLYSGQMVRRFAESSTPSGEVAFSPDGRTVLAGSTDGTVTLWDVETGEEIHRLVIDQPVNAVTFSPDGGKALIGAGYEDVQEIVSGHIILWDVKKGAEIRRFEGQPYAVTAVAFSPDGRLAASSGNGAMAILWDAETGTEIRRFEDYWVDSPWSIEAYTDVAFSPDGKQIFASHDDGNIIGWDVESGEDIQQLVGHKTGALGVSFSNDGQQLVSAGMDSQVILWDMSTGNLQRRLVQANGMEHPQFSPDGMLLLGGKITGITILLQVETGEVIRRYDDFAESLSFSPDGRHAVVGYRDGGVEMWRIDSTLDELLTWTRNNRYIPELTCEQRELYKIEPRCELES
jgi:WD40 repeat protein